MRGDTIATVVLPRRFNGPPASANGGYAAGVLGSRFDGPAEVTLRRPVPLDTELWIAPDGDGLVLRDGSGDIAQGRATDALAIIPPVHPSLADARVAASRFPGLEPGGHPLPTCFVCGLDRADGLGLHAGPLPGTPAVRATPLVVHAGLPAAADGTLAPELVWAALDCPSYPDYAGALSLLGRMAAEVLRPVRRGDELIVLGWDLGPAEGRKRATASAIVDERGELFARARATWITLRGGTLPPGAA